MKARSFAVSLSLLALAALPVLAQDKPKEPAAPGMGAADMAAMEKAVAPGEPHKQLARRTGDWTFTSKAWMAPGQPPAESSGTMHAEMILGGRYLQSTWTGNFMNMSFEGRGVDGYDNVGKEFVSSWMDNMGTGIIHSTGTCDEGGHKCSLRGDMMDPMTGQKSYLRTETSWKDDRSFKMEMFGPGPDGKEFKWMEMTVVKK